MGGGGGKGVRAGRKGEPVPHTATDGHRQPLSHADDMSIGAPQVRKVQLRPVRGRSAVRSRQHQGTVSAALQHEVYLVDVVLVGHVPASDPKVHIENTDDRATPPTYCTQLPTALKPNTSHTHFGHMATKG
jgi:hypothetical protein